jgi:hypothetical protein
MTSSHTFQRIGPWLGLAVIGIGLPFDAFGGMGTQVVVSVAAWAMALAVIETTAGEQRRRLVACIAIATAGELFLSLVWGLYDYRFLNVPLFVPPGHMLLMAVGIAVAACRLPRLLVPCTVGAAVAIAAHAAWTGRGTLDVALVALLLLCIRFAPSRGEAVLYAVMFWLALLLEFYGTALGNWAWQPVEGWFGLTSSNPPLAAGAFYSALDMLSLWAARLALGSGRLPAFAPILRTWRPVRARRRASAHSPAVRRAR